MTLRKSDTHDSTGITMLKVCSATICSVATDNSSEFVCARCESLRNAFAVYISRALSVKSVTMLRLYGQKFSLGRT